MAELFFEWLLGRMTMAPNDNVVGNPLVVCTAHIHWDPEFCDVKLIQSMMLVQEICTLLDEVPCCILIGSRTFGQLIFLFVGDC